jgi:spermidine/putrescine transport system ATP-binding protein
VPTALLDSSRDVEIGVRPEKIRLTSADQTPPAGANLLHGVIRDASYMGVSTQYIVQARGGVAVTVYEQNVERATKSELWSPGEEVTLSWLPDHSFVIHGPRPPERAEGS